MEIQLSSMDTYIKLFFFFLTYIELLFNVSSMYIGGCHHQESIHQSWATKSHKNWSPQDVTRAEISDLISMTKTVMEDDYPFKTMD